MVTSFYAFIANYTSSNIAPVLQLWPTVYPTEPKDFSQLSYIVAVRLPLNSTQSQRRHVC